MVGCPLAHTSHVYNVVHKKERKKENSIWQPCVRLLILSCYVTNGSTERLVNERKRQKAVPIGTIVCTTCTHSRSQLLISSSPTFQLSNCDYWQNAKWAVGHISFSIFRNNLSQLPPTALTRLVLHNNVSAQPSEMMERRHICDKASFL